MTSDQSLKGGMDKSVKDDDESMAEEQKTETVQNSPARHVDDLEAVVTKYLIPKY